MRTMTCRAAIAGAFALSGLAFLAPPAVAGTPTCVSKDEFKAVRDGWSITRVHNKFDVNGKQDYYTDGYPGPYGWPAEQSRSYKACTQYGTAYVDYERINGTWRVASKSAYW